MAYENGIRQNKYCKKMEHKHRQQWYTLADFGFCGTEDYNTFVKNYEDKNPWAIDNSFYASYHKRYWKRDKFGSRRAFGKRITNRINRANLRKLKVMDVESIDELPILTRRGETRVFDYFYWLF